MVARALLLTLVLLGAPLLAGCLKGPDEGGALDTASTEDEFNTTAPDGRTLVAFEETNETEEGSGGVDHHHDYWAGRDRVEIFKTEAMMQPLGSGNAADYKAQATFRPPQGTFIYEATERIDFFITNPRRHVCEGEFTLGGFWVCTDTIDNYGAAGQSFPEVPAQPDPNPPTGLKLRYKHAATTQWIDAGEIVWDTALPIQITNPIQTDMPHATSSVWEFQVISPNTHDTTLVFDAKAEIVRGGVDIPMWPGHPNFYTDSTWRKVLSAQWGACDNGFGASACLLAGENVGPIHAERLISYGTRTVYVWVNITEMNFPNPATTPSNWFLFHRNSTGRDNVTDVFDDENHPIDQKEHLWVLPVDDNGMDSPYADGSRWNFELGAALRTVLSCYGGCAEWSAKYTIEVITTNETLPLEEYDMYCLRDDYCPSPEDDGGEEETVMATQRMADGREKQVAFTRA